MSKNRNYQLFTNILSKHECILQISFYNKQQLYLQVLTFNTSISQKKINHKNLNNNKFL